MVDKLSSELHAGLDRLADETSILLNFDAGGFPAALDVGSRQWGSLEEAMARVPAAEKTAGASLVGSMMRDKFLKTASEAQSPGEFIAERIQAVSELGYDKFSFLAVSANGTIAMLMRPSDNPDRVSVMRIVPHPNSPTFNAARRADSQRSEFPMLLQPSAEIIAIGQKGENYFQAETLALGQIIALSETQYKTYSEFLKALTAGTVYDPHPGREVMALQDGTVLMFDPGEAPYKAEFHNLSADAQAMEIDHSNEMIASRLKAWNVPEMFNPFTADGSLKQYAVHPPEDGMRREYSQHPAPNVA